MAFIADNKALRTYDPERGIELFKTGGGSDGTMYFRLVGPDGEYNFSAIYYLETLRPDELERLGPDYDKEPFVWSVTGAYGKWKPIIREAMMAYKIVHGRSQPNIEVFVRLGMKESVFDDQ